LKNKLSKDEPKKKPPDIKYKENKGFNSDNRRTQ